MITNDELIAVLTSAKKELNDADDTFFRNEIKLTDLQKGILQGDRNRINKIMELLK